MISIREQKTVVRVSDTQYRVISTSVQGSPGVSSGNAYTHTQTSASTEWIINHNLGFYPTVTVLSAGLVEVDAAVIHTSLNQTRVYFVASFAGMARLH